MQLYPILMITCLFLENKSLESLKNKAYGLTEYYFNVYIFISKKYEFGNNEPCH